MSNEVVANSKELQTKFKDLDWGSGQLKTILLFKSFQQDQLKKIYSIGKIKTLKRMSHAVIEGEPSRGLFLILSGKLSVFKNDSRLATLEDGDSFGELSLFDEAPRSATVVADTLSYLFHLPADRFEKFLDDHGDKVKADFYKTCAIMMSERFRHLNTDYIASQQLLWKYAFRKNDSVAVNPEK